MVVYNYYYQNYIVCLSYGSTATSNLLNEAIKMRINLPLPNFADNNYIVIPSTLYCENFAYINLTSVLS